MTSPGPAPDPAAPLAPAPLLAVEGLNVTFATPDGRVPAVRAASFAVAPGEVLGVVGESGSGKSQMFLALMGLLAGNGRATGNARFGRDDLLALPPGRLRRLRGARIAMVFQDPMTALNPYLTVATQMTEVLVAHRGLSHRDARAEAITMLERVRIPGAAHRIDQHPHAFSGGMRQRVMIAIAALCRPDLIIADEPTTALDVTVQAEVLALLAELRRDLGTTIVLISHNLGVVAGLADRVLVMYAGEIVEDAPVRSLFYHPRHPYTRALLASIAHPGRAGRGYLTAIPGQPPNLLTLPPGCAFHERCAFAEGRCRTETPPLRAAAAGARRVACHRDAVPALDHAPPPAPEIRAEPDPGSAGRHLTVEALTVSFARPRGLFRRPERLSAVEDVHFSLAAGETLGVVGESGCGKSTLARAVLGLVPANAGRVVWLGRDLTGLAPAALRPMRRNLQVVFQDPVAALDPCMTVGELIGEPVRVFQPQAGGTARADQVAAMMARVGLAPDQVNRFPHELSGGQAQRVGIARAMILEPQLVVCDEPTSALDVSIQAQIINLLIRLQVETGLSLLFISHDLGVIRRISHRVLVLFAGRVMELAPTETLFAGPRHPYTRQLLAALPWPDPDRERSKQPPAPAVGEPPSPLHPPSGCRFRARCPQAEARCAESVPPRTAIGLDHLVYCHRSSAPTPTPPAV